jgi:hypothetical protein
MGHRLAWDNEDQTVVLQEYTTDPSKDDLYHLAQKSAKMLTTVEHTVHLIVDERNSNIRISSTDMTYLERIAPKNQGVVVVVVPESKVRFKTAMQGLGEKIAPTAFRKAYFLTSLEDARRFLQDNFGVHFTAEKMISIE